MTTTQPISPRDRETLFAGLNGTVHAGLAVSGGADSLALMHLAHDWRAERGDSGPRFTVLTVDHGLRRESAREADWVAERARALGLPCAILRWQPERGISGIQEAARAARYTLMADYAHAHGLDALVTAHHLDDQAETLLMRLGRGSGVDGLAGIPGEGAWAGLRLLRPLLDVPKARLAAALEARGIGWLEDPGNSDERFERVRVRAAMDELARLGIGAEALALSAKRLRRALAALDAAAGRFLSEHARLDEAGVCRIGMDAFRAATGETAIRALGRALQGVGGQVSPPRLAKLEALAETLRDGAEGTQTLGGCEIVREAGEILLLRETGRMGRTAINLHPGETGLWDNRYRVGLDAGAPAPVEVRALGERGYGEVRARLGRPVSLPARAGEGLVSFWRGGEVLAVPPLAYAAGRSEGAGCTAELVNRGLFSAPR